MNREEANKWKVEIQAYLDGEEIQVKLVSDGQYVDIPCPTWMVNCEYRIKRAAPQVTYFLVRTGAPRANVGWASRHEALAAASIRGTPGEWEARRFVETPDVD